MFGFFKFLLGSFFSLVLIIVLILGYFGFIPGVSNLFGSNKPRFLDVSFTQADLDSARSKSNVVWKDLPPSDNPEQTLKFEGVTPLNNSFTDKELTAMIQNDKWRYNFLPDTKVKFNDDGSLEMAGTFHIDRLEGYARAHKISYEAIKPAVEVIGKVSKTPAYYLKGTGNVVNNQVTFDITNFEVGRLGIPTETLNQASPAVALFIEERIFSTVPGLDIQSLVIKDKKINYKGTFPKIINVTPL